MVILLKNKKRHEKIEIEIEISHLILIFHLLYISFLYCSFSFPYSLRK